MRIPDISCTINERWRPIRNYPNYEVSNFGRVRNRHKIIMKPFENQGAFHKYLRVRIRNKDGARNFYVHRLVAAAFCEKKHYSKNQVHHKDRDTFNNQHTNLAWATPLEHHPAYASDLPF